MKLFTKYTALLIGACMAVAALTGCSSHRSTDVTNESPKPGRVVAMKVPEVATLAATYQPWETLYAPFNLRVSKPMSMSVSGRATMVRDHSILLSLRMLGFMEVATVYIDADSAIIADKVHRYLVAVPLSAITSRTGVTIGDIQSIMLGQAFYPGKNTINLTSNANQLFSVSHDDGGMIMTPRKVPAGATWYYNVSDVPALTALSVEPDGHSPFTAKFDATTDTPAGACATDIAVNGEFSGKQIDASVSWNFGKAEWNTGRQAERPTYSGYQRITIAQLMAALKNMR